MFDKKLELVLEHQFYGFLNIVLRNMWVFRMGKTPRHLVQRTSQINSALRLLGLAYDIDTDYHLHGLCMITCYTPRAKDLCDLIVWLTQKLEPRTLRRLSESGHVNVKLSVLGTRPAAGFSPYDFRQLSYRKRLYRALKTLVELKLIKKRSPPYYPYYPTELGFEIGDKIVTYHNRWVERQTDCLLHYFSSIVGDSSIEFPHHSRTAVDYPHFVYDPKSRVWQTTEQ